MRLNLAIVLTLCLLLCSCQESSYQVRGLPPQAGDRYDMIQWVNPDSLMLLEFQVTRFADGDTVSTSYHYMPVDHPWPCSTLTRVQSYQVEAN